MAQIIPQGQISTCGALHNSSWSTLHYALCHDWEGHVSPQAPYPPSIENGECGKFVHDGLSVPIVLQLGSVAAVVYRGGRCIPGAATKMVDWLVAWSNHPRMPSGPNCPLMGNKVYAEIAEAETPWNWDTIKMKLDKGQSSAECDWEGYRATVTIDQGTSAQLEGTINFLRRE